MKRVQGDSISNIPKPAWKISKQLKESVAKKHPMTSKSDEEAIGLVLGAVFGAALAGPEGAVLGALIGAALTSRKGGRL